MTKNLPKPFDREGWNKRQEELFQSIFGKPHADALANIPKPVAPEKETEK